jgi:hypothetical protein
LKKKEGRKINVKKVLLHPGEVNYPSLIRRSTQLRLGARTNPSLPLTQTARMSSYGTPTPNPMLKRRKTLRLIFQI